MAFVFGCEDGIENVPEIHLLGSSCVVHGISRRGCWRHRAESSRARGMGLSLPLEEASSPVHASALYVLIRQFYTFINIWASSRSFIFQLFLGRNKLSLHASKIAVLWPQTGQEDGNRSWKSPAVNQHFPVPVLDGLITCCATLGKSLPLSGPQYVPHYC